MARRSAGRSSTPKQRQRYRRPWQNFSSGRRGSGMSPHPTICFFLRTKVVHVKRGDGARRTAPAQLTHGHDGVDRSRSREQLSREFLIVGNVITRNDFDHRLILTTGRPFFNYQSITSLPCRNNKQQASNSNNNSNKQQTTEVPYNKRKKQRKTVRL